MTTPQIITPRLNLRPFTEDDAPLFYQLLQKENILQYFPNPATPSLEKVEKMIQGIFAHWERYGYGLWAVEEKSTQTFVGRSGLQYLPETQEVEIDFLLGAPFWGKGYATEAGQYGLQFGFGQFFFEEIIGIVHPDNKASQRVLTKLGMTHMETTEYFGMACERYVLKNVKK